MGWRPPTVGAALRGEHPFGPTDRRLAEHDLATLETLAARSGMQRLVAEWLVALENDPNHQLVSRIARRKNLPFSVVEGWSDDDLAHELAADLLEAKDRAERCPDCQTLPADTLDLSDPDNIRPWDRGRWKWELHSCWFCGQGTRAGKQLTDDDKDQGLRFKIASRAPGDPEIDSG